MLNFQKIIVPVDLDKNTTKLVEYALYIAGQFDAEVILLHTVEFIVMGEMALGNLTYDDYNTSRKEAAGKALNEIVQEVAKTERGKKCTSRVLLGDTVDEILACAKEEHCDLIIMGSHGKRGLEKILLGSVAERVLKNAHCPVLIMNPYR